MQILFNPRYFACSQLRPVLHISAEASRAGGSMNATRREVLHLDFLEDRESRVVHAVVVPHNHPITNPLLLLLLLSAHKRAAVREELMPRCVPKVLPASGIDRWVSATDGHGIGSVARQLRQMSVGVQVRSGLRTRIPCPQRG